MSRNKKSGSVKGTPTGGALRLLVALVSLAALIYIAVVGIGFEQSGSAHDIKLGLDLAGGVSITYQATEENPSSEDMADTKYKLQKRADSYSSEAEVYQEGTNRINVDIPDVTDANKILEEMGTPGSLVFLDPEENELFADIKGNAITKAQAGIIDSNKDGNSEYIVSLTFSDEASKEPLQV